MGDILDNFQKAKAGKPYGSDFLNASPDFMKLMESLDKQDRAATEDAEQFLRDIKAKDQIRKVREGMKIWITTYWTTEIKPVVTPFDNQEAAKNCARYYKRQGYKVCIDECNIFHKCTEQAESEE